MEKFRRRVDDTVAKAYLPRERDLENVVPSNVQHGPALDAQGGRAFDELTHNAQ